MIIFSSSFPSDYLVDSLFLMSMETFWIWIAILEAWDNFTGNKKSLKTLIKQMAVKYALIILVSNNQGEQVSVARSTQ